MDHTGDSTHSMSLFWYIGARDGRTVLTLRHRSDVLAVVFQMPWDVRGRSSGSEWASYNPFGNCGAIHPDMWQAMGHTYRCVADGLMGGATPSPDFNGVSMWGDWLLKTSAESIFYCVGSECLTVCLSYGLAEAD